MSQISDDARKMRDYIIENGWTQGTLYEYDGSVCLLGACTKVVSKQLSARHTPVIGAMQEYTGVDYVPDWNDTDGRTKQEVLDMLENVAIKYDDDAMRSAGNE